MIRISFLKVLTNQNIQIFDEKSGRVLFNSGKHPDDCVCMAVRTSFTGMEKVDQLIMYSLSSAEYQASF